MARKQFYLVIDTETTIAETVADFGALVVDRKGVIFNQCAVLVKNHFDKHDLFYHRSDKEQKSFWSFQNMQVRKTKYFEMVDNGQRLLASVQAVNNWLLRVIGQYPNIALTAYNLPFDLRQCENTKIDLSAFVNRFCLWDAAIGNICELKQYKQFCLDNHLFNPVTEKGNCTYKTTAEAVYSFINQGMLTEPHTALEDCIIEACSILPEIVKRKKWREKSKPYNWRNVQLKDNFTVK